MNKHQQSFVEYLVSLAKNKDLAALAKIRRCRWPRYRYQAGEYIYHFLPTQSDSWANECYLEVASIFAEHRLHSSNTSFGRTMSMVMGNNKGRFNVFLSSKNNGVFVHLRHLVSMAGKAPINYIEILNYLCHWNHHDRWAQNKLAKDFWMSQTESSTAAAQLQEEN